jgi:polar amino acid transport system substrate-binding protein
MSVNRYAGRLRPLLIVVMAAAAVAAGGTGGVAGVSATMMSQTTPTDKSADAAVQSATPVKSGNPASGQPEAIDAGRKLFGTWCIQCHGPKADGVSRFGQYAADLRVYWRGYREFVTIVKDGRPQKQMPPWKEVLDDTKIAQIGAYLETLALDGANWK